MIVARARYIEDLVLQQIDLGGKQYVLLGAGIDTFSQRNPKIASQIQVYEIDKPGTQEWKRKRLLEEGYSIPPWLHFVPVDFESYELSWWKQLVSSGFNPQESAIVASTGVSMYLSIEAIHEIMRQMAKLAPSSLLVMTFMLPLELVDPMDQPGYQMALKGAKASGTPFISFLAPAQMLELAQKSGFKKVEHLSVASLSKKYFIDRTDGLRTSTGEGLLIGAT